jgi:hypothetical protein
VLFPQVELDDENQFADLAPHAPTTLRRQLTLFDLPIRREQSSDRSIRLLNQKPKSVAGIALPAVFSSRSNRLRHPEYRLTRPYR